MTVEARLYQERIYLLNDIRSSTIYGEQGPETKIQLEKQKFSMRRFDYDSKLHHEMTADIQRVPIAILISAATQAPFLSECCSRRISLLVNICENAVYR